MTTRHRFQPRRLAAVLALAALVAAGCGGDDDTASGGGGSGCDSSDPFRVGTIFPLTGVTADTGEKMTVGAEMARDELNEGGGVLGRCVELVAEDEANDPTQAAQAASELIDREEVEFLVGPAGSGPTGSVAEISTQAEVPVAHAATSVFDSDENPYMFNVQIGSPLIGPSFVTYAQARGWSSIAVLSVNNAFGTSVTDAFTEAAEEEGIEITDSEVHESGLVDVTPQLRSLRQTDPDALVVVNFGADAIATLEARAELGWDVPVLGPSGLSFDEVVEAVGPEAMTDVYSSMYPARLAADEATGAIASEAGEEFRRRVKDETGEDPLRSSLDAVGLGYDGLMVLATAVDEVGENDPDMVRDWLIENGVEGVRADFRWEDGSSEGFPLDANAIVVASSLEDGVLTLAPDQ